MKSKDSKKHDIENISWEDKKEKLRRKIMMFDFFDDRKSCPFLAIASSSRNRDVAKTKTPKNSKKSITNTSKTTST